MFNVLPNIFKKEIRSEYYLRRLIVILIFVIFTQITFLVFIFPSWLSSFYQHEEVSMQMESQKSTVVSQNTNNILQTIKTTNQNLGIIDSAFSYSKVLSLIQDIISVKTSAVSLSEFTYSNSAIGQGDGGTGSQTTAGQALATSAAGRSMSVSGIAQTREDLVGFVKKLQDSGFFSDVVSPISDLAKDKDISFSINLNVK
jgi:hypothetical protein